MDVVTACGFAVDNFLGFRCEVRKANRTIAFDGFAVGVQILVVRDRD